MLQTNNITTYLATNLLFDDARIGEYKKKALLEQKTLESLLIDEGIVKEKDLYTFLSKQMNMPLIDLKEVEITQDLIAIIPQPLAETHNIICFGKSKNTVDLALLDPTDLQTIEFVGRKTGLTPRVSLTTPSSIKHALRLYHADLEEELKKVGFSERKKKLQISGAQKSS